MRTNAIWCLVLGGFIFAMPASGELTLPKLDAPPVIDGDLDDAAWHDAVHTDQFYEFEHTDNGPPPVQTIAFFAYDSHFLYVGVDCRDPHPNEIRAPFVERDHVFGDQDNVAVFIDAIGDGASAVQLRVNPRGIQGDAISNDVARTEDFGPDFHYDAAARITSSGWSAEFRIPLSTLHYHAGKAVPPWGVLVIRNWPRDFRYLMASVRLPRGSNCVVCHEDHLTGISDLPASDHVSIAPYTATEWQSASVSPHATAAARTGADVKWSPFPQLSVDATVHPDFSQIEADVPQVTANRRFALFYPEKRPFFLEGADLLDTPIPAVYTRTMNTPEGGIRLTERGHAVSWTAMAVQDGGGGLQVLPGPYGSTVEPSEGRSFVGLLRSRVQRGEQLIGALFSTRENANGEFNRVFGPDLEIRPTADDDVKAQVLMSMTREGSERFDGSAIRVSWNHDEADHDWFLQADDFGRHFRADSGFVPQVGYRQISGGGGRDWFREKGRLARLRLYGSATESVDAHGNLLQQDPVVGFYASGARSFAAVLEIHAPVQLRVASGHVFSASYVHGSMDLSPSSRLPAIGLAIDTGQAIDYEESRPARVRTLGGHVTLRPTDRVEVEINGTREYLTLRRSDDAHLLTADVAWLKATYSFSRVTWVRLTEQHARTTRNERAYVVPGSILERTDSFSLLFAHQLNWQTVFYAGIDRNTGDVSADTSKTTLVMKVSYAFQR